MIDLHSHILPGCDDGSPSLSVSLEMARIAEADGIVTMACTPHIKPGVYANNSNGIGLAVDSLAEAISHAGIALELTTGADAHLDPKLLSGLMGGTVPTICGSRYFLLEPPHDVFPPRMEDFALSFLSSGFVPILTHPERLGWISGRFDAITRIARAGVLMQLTGNSLTGQFGREPKYWSERMIDEGIVDLLASDAHNTTSRQPKLAESRDIVGKRVGEDRAQTLVAANPLSILQDLSPEQVISGRGA
ncbi:MAG: capsular biosynthesis protein [Hyphomicrobiales bacterium]|nr:capsular biosynthesis protein [Hyphomicrobiales bacterium]